MYLKLSANVKTLKNILKIRKWHPKSNDFLLKLAFSGQITGFDDNNSHYFI